MNLTAAGRVLDMPDLDNASKLLVFVTGDLCNIMVNLFYEFESNAKELKNCHK